MRFVCAYCGKPGEKATGHVNRSRAIGASLFCNRRCYGMAKRQHKPKRQRVAEKRLYDMEYRRKNLAAIRAKKAAYFQATYDPEEARVYRKKRMPYHVEYCRRPEYKRWKSEYDRQLRAKEFGAFAEAYRLTIDLNREIKGRMTNEQIKWQNQTANKTQFRKRASGQGDRGRPRHRSRRDRHTATVG